jgi:hypothetical protein
MIDENGPLAIVHVTRPLPPWRKPEHQLTECGLRTSQHQALGADEFERRLTDWGRQRTAMMTCMTCYSTYERYRGATWEKDPVRALAREAEKARWYRPDSERRERMDIELRALMQLVADHSEEFDAIVARLEWHEQTVKDRDVRRSSRRAQRK